MGGTFGESWETGARTRTAARKSDFIGASYHGEHGGGRSARRIERRRAADVFSEVSQERGERRHAHPGLRNYGSQCPAFERSMVRHGDAVVRRRPMTEDHVTAGLMI